MKFSHMSAINSISARSYTIRFLRKWGTLLSVTSFLCGVIWMVMLAHSELSAKSYVSENALLPGTVMTQYRYTHYADEIYHNLQRECTSERAFEMEEFLENEMRVIGLDVYVQNFSVHSKRLSGTNVYGIYRAPRASGVESLILNAPLRKDCSNNGGISLVLGLAKFFRQQSYWAKDLVFLFTSEEMYGMKAWLEAYSNEQNPDIISSPFLGYAGSIQAAVTLDFSSNQVLYFNILFEGLNGQLPNLDLINLALRIGNVEGVPLRFQYQDYAQDHRPDHEAFLNRLQTLARMMLVLASGYPTGNHGMFYKYRIEAITLQGVQPRLDVNRRYRRLVDFEMGGRLVEGMFRSFNNLLEKFHQSFFLYVLPAQNRYVSIGLYMPPLGLLLAPLLVSLTTLWVELFLPDELSEKPADFRHASVHEKDDLVADDVGGGRDSMKSEESHTKDSLEASKPSLEPSLTRLLCRDVLRSSVTACCFGVALNVWLPNVVNLKLQLELSDRDFFLGVVFVLALVPFFARACVGKLIQEWRSTQLVIIIYTLLALVLISIVNFPLAFFGSMFLVLPAALVTCEGKRLWKYLHLFLVIFLSPPMALYFLCLLSIVPLSNLETFDWNLLDKAFELWNRVLALSLTSASLGTWTQSVLTLVLFPIWVGFASLAAR